MLDFAMKKLRKLSICQMTETADKKSIDRMTIYFITQPILLTINRVYTSVYTSNELQNKLGDRGPWGCWSLIWVARFSQNEVYNMADRNLKNICFEQNQHCIWSRNGQKRTHMPFGACFIVGVCINVWYRLPAHKCYILYTNSYWQKVKSQFIIYHSCQYKIDFSACAIRRAFRFRVNWRCSLEKGSLNPKVSIIVYYIVVFCYT